MSERVIENVSAEAHNEQKRELKWKKSGGGRGNRWLMLRDLLSILSLRPMSNNLVQDTMLLMRGLKRSTVRDMLDQLERTKSIEQVEDASGPIRQWVWVATEGGVQYWIGSRGAIPASIAAAANTMRIVNVLEVGETG